MDLVRIRRLTVQDGRVLRHLAENNSDFTGSSETIEPLAQAALSNAAAEEYLTDPFVWHWVAEHERNVVGFLMCLVQRRRHGDRFQLMLYDMGVHRTHRRRGIATRMIGEMAEEMSRWGIRKAWVLADNPVAVAAYQQNGFTQQETQGVTMQLIVQPRSSSA
jgi:GNAT superfamily N-acetyltransferase